MENKRLSFVCCIGLSIVVGAVSTHVRAADAPTSASTPAADDSQAALQKLSDRITELEVQNRLNRVQLSGVFISHYESFDNKHGVPGVPMDEEKVNPLGMYFGINADFDVSKNLKVYSTLGMSKFFNDEGRAETLTDTSYYATYQASEMGAWAYAGATVKFDRAFASYDFDTIPLTLAIGRMPTNNGPPLNQENGLPRGGTYPRFAFNAIFDGIAAVYDFSSLLPKDNTFKVRLFYQPFINGNPGDRTLQFVDSYRILSNVPQAAALMEYGKTNLGNFADRLDVMYMHAYWHEFYDGYTNTSVPYQPGAAPPGTPPFGQTENGSDDAFYVGVENIGKFGLNVSWSGLLYQAIDSGLPNLQKSSFAHFVSINQRIKPLRNGILGYEFVSTPNFHYLDEWTRMNIIPFGILENSTGHHVYFSMPLAKHTIGRIGFYRLVAGAGDVFQPQATDAYSYYSELRIEF